VIGNWTPDQLLQFIQSHLTQDQLNQTNIGLQGKLDKPSVPPTVAGDALVWDGAHWVANTLDPSSITPGSLGQLITNRSGTPAWTSNTIVPFFNNCTGALTLTTSAQDVPGCSRTVTTVGANALVFCIGAFDFNIATTGVTQCFGNFMINGSDNGIVAIKQDEGNANDRSTHTITHVFSVPTGSNTVKLRAKKSAAGGSASVPNVITMLTTIWFDF